MKKPAAVALVSLGIAGLGWSASAQEISAPEILAKVEAKYAGLTSLAVTGRVITDIGTSEGKTPAAAPQTDELKDYPGQAGKVTTFSIRLGKPDLYRIEWSQKITERYTQKGAAWSSGSGDFLLLGDKKQSIEGGMDMTLASATGVSGGVAAILPPVFFAHQTNELTILSNLARLPEKKIGSNDCYVVSGNLNGNKLILWITKDYRLIQNRMVSEGAVKMPKMSDEDITKALKMAGQTATPEVIAQMKEIMNSARAKSSTAKRSMTQIYETFEANPPLKKESFDFESAPKGKSGN